jgi:hypothetical protein
MTDKIFIVNDQPADRDARGFTPSLTPIARKAS